MLGSFRVDARSSVDAALTGRDQVRRTDSTFGWLPASASVSAVLLEAAAEEHRWRPELVAIKSIASDLERSSEAGLAG
jgi:hypothetical protein